MSQQDSPIQEASQTCCTRSRCCRLCGLLVGLVLGSLAAIVLFLIHLPQYQAMASIQVRSAKPRFLDEDIVVNRYEEFVNTQIELLRSNVVIDRMLEMPDVARLPIIRQLSNKREWLQKKLKIVRHGKSEIVTISIKTFSKESSENIVNAVVDSYLILVDDFTKQTDNALISNLEAEKRRLNMLIPQLYRSPLKFVKTVESFQ